MFAPEAAKISVAEIVGQNKDEVGFILGLSPGERQKSYDGEAGDDFVHIVSKQDAFGSASARSLLPSVVD
jgi:hypothetical protein